MVPLIYFSFLTFILYSCFYCQDRIVINMYITTRMLSHYYANMYIMVFNLYYLLFANLFCLLKSTERKTKRKSHTNSIHRLISYFGMNRTIFRVYIFAYMYALEFMF